LIQGSVPDNFGPSFAYGPTGTGAAGRYCSSAWRFLISKLFPTPTGGGAFFSWRRPLFFCILPAALFFSMYGGAPALAKEIRWKKKKPRAFLGKTSAPHTFLASELAWELPAEQQNKGPVGVASSTRSVGRHGKVRFRGWPTLAQRVAPPPPIRLPKK